MKTHTNFQCALGGETTGMSDADLRVDFIPDTDKFELDEKENHELWLIFNAPTYKKPGSKSN